MYDRSTWMYEGGEVAAAAGVREHSTQAFEQKTGAGMLVGDVRRDDTLQDPRCVFQILRRHFSRYTPETVERVCGISEADFLDVAQTLIENSGRERTTAFCYAVGWTQHTAGSQMIRAAAILQLLLGNIGRPGGGILALRGHASIQGSTDIPTLYDLLPGYLHMPHAGDEELDLERYIASGRANRGWWSFFPVYIVSLLKARFGEALWRAAGPPPTSVCAAVRSAARCPTTASRSHAAPPSARGAAPWAERACLSSICCGAPDRVVSR